MTEIKEIKEVKEKEIKEKKEKVLTFHDKIVVIQSKLKAPKEQRNSFGNYNYRSCEDILEAVKPLLKEQGLRMSISDEIEFIGNRFYIKAVVKLTDGKDEVLTTSYAREEETKKGQDGSQITGASSSYARKYALNGMFLIDDTKDSDVTNTHDKDTEQPKTKVTMITEGQITTLKSMYNEHSEAMARELNRLGKNKFADLTIKEASDLIGLLKGSN